MMNRWLSFWVVLIWLFPVAGDVAGGTGTGESLTAGELLRNLETREFSGSPLFLLLRDAPIRNLFEKGSGSIPPVFPSHSGLKFMVAGDLDMTITVKSEGEPWDRVLWRVLEENSLRAVAKGNRILIVRRSENQVPNKPLALPDATGSFRRVPQTDPDILVELHRPASLQVAGERLFVVDRGRVKMYSLPEPGLLMTLGSPGQGPAEFQPYPELQDQGMIRLSVRPNALWVGSRNKISRFSPAGDWEQDIPMGNPAACGVIPFGDGFIGFEVSRFPTWRHDFYMYHPQRSGRKRLLSVAKAIHTEKSVRRGPKLVLRDLLYSGPECRVRGDLCYILGRAGLFLDVFDTRGDKVSEIRCDFPAPGIGGEERQKILALYRDNMRGIWSQAGKVIHIPGEFPRFRTFRIDGDQIYIQTYTKEKAGTVFYRMSIEGKEYRRVVVRLPYRDFLSPYPYAIAGNTLYALVEDQDSGDWRLVRRRLE